MDGLRADDPRRVGPFRLLGRLGAGGMGQVYLGRGPGGRTVAVKRVRIELLGDEHGFRQRFAREVEAALRVEGRFTAPVVAADAYAEIPWLATAYIPGMALGEALTGYGPLPEDTLGHVAAGLADALTAIHAVGLVHRDLKPANVMLAADGPKVIDFGIALLDGASALTRTGHTVGTLGFMSPEQFERADVGPASDVFSYGALLAFAATGRLPFGSGPWPVLLANLTTKDADLDGVADAFLPLLRACLDKNPQDRPTPAQARALVPRGAGTDDAGWLPAPLAYALLRIAATALDADDETDAGSAVEATEDVEPVDAVERVERVEPVGDGEQPGLPEARPGLPAAVCVLPAGMQALAPVGPGGAQAEEEALPPRPAVANRGGHHRLPSGRRAWPAVVAAVTVVALVAGLVVWRLITNGSGGGPDGAAEASAGSDAGRAFKVGLSLPDDRAELGGRAAFEQRVRQACLDCTVEYANAGQDAGRQRAQVDALIAAGVRVLVLGAVAPRDAAPMVAAAKARGIPVLAYDRLAAGPVSGHVTFDAQAVGRLQGQALLDALQAGGDPRRGSIVMLNGAPTDPVGAEFKRGAHTVLDGKVTIGREYDVVEGSADEARRLTAEALAALGGPRQVIGVYAADDTLAGGAAQALADAGGAGSPLTGQNTELAALRRIVAGTQTMTVAKPARLEAETAADMALALARGRRLDRADVIRDNGTTGVPTVLLQPLTISRATISRTPFKDGGITPRDVCTAELVPACLLVGLDPEGPGRPPAPAPPPALPRDARP